MGKGRIKEKGGVGSGGKCGREQTRHGLTDGNCPSERRDEQNKTKGMFTGQ